MWEQYPYCKLNCFEYVFALAQYRSFHSALRDVREVFHSSMRSALQAVAAHLTAVYHSCAGYSIFKFLICPSTYKELGEAFWSPISQDLHIVLYSCTTVGALAALILSKKSAPATVKVTSAVWLSNIYYGTFILICIKCGDIYFSFSVTFYLLIIDNYL